MRAKTYLAPEQQWDRTVRLYMQRGTYARSAHCVLGDWVLLGRIVRTHRLFLPGDFVLVERTHGGGGRHVVFAVSSKGYQIERMFLKYETLSQQYREQPKGVKSKRKLTQMGWPALTSGRRACFLTEHGSGPMRIVELPGNVEGCFPDSPAVRQFVVETLAREAYRKPGKRE